MGQETTDRLSVDAQAPGLLAGLAGARPPAPAWFEANLAVMPERLRITVQGAGLELLAWGERGRPGLLLLHGNGAHADWWSFLAPFFADRYRIAALSWSGMGGSDWRERYYFSVFAEEMLVAAEAAGLFEAPVKPIVCAHSFGGFITLHAAARFGERLGGAVIVDSPIEPPGTTPDRPPPRHRPNRIYATAQEAIARFRLAPPQPCDNLYAIDHIARLSIKPVEGGHTWKFDPFIWREFEVGDPTPLLQRPACPVALMWGARSSLVRPEIVKHMSAVAPRGAPLVPIPEADHHVMLDQPLAFAAALRALLAGWPGG
jgi:pimeloyl-ACP methyl ester carboxylesterase